MKIEDIHNVLIVGAGTMGRQIGLQCAIYGYSVVIYDISPDALKESTGHIRIYTDELISNNRLTEEEAAASLNRITTASNPEKAAAAVHLLIESVPEIPELKHKVFAQFNELCPSNTIFTTNTSSLIPSMLLAATGRPSKFAAMHFSPYVWETGVVEIMPHQGTSETTTSLLETFARRIGQFPIVLRRENPGYVSNALLNALNSSALSLVSSGIASAEDIDRVWMSITKMHIGPFGSMDFIGLDIVYQVTQYWANIIGNPQILNNAKFLKEFVNKGNTGVKSGQGFYTYPDPDFEKADFLSRKHKLLNKRNGVQKNSSEK